jgi:hypothetical protein
MVTSIRITEDLYERIREDAEREKRSITKQIEYMIEQFYKIQKMTAGE